MKVFEEKEVAKLTKRGVQTLRNDRAMRRGIPFVKLGRSVRYLEEDLLAYIRKHRVDTENEAA